MFTLLAAATGDPVKLDEATVETIKGLFSEQMKEIVIQASTQNMVVYAFLVIAVILLLVTAYTTRINTQNIKQSMVPYIEEIKTLRKTLENFSKSHSKIMDKLDKLENDLIRHDCEGINTDDRINAIGDELKEISKLIRSMNGR